MSNVFTLWAGCGAKNCMSLKMFVRMGEKCTGSIQDITKVNGTWNSLTKCVAVLAMWDVLRE